MPKRYDQKCGMCEAGCAFFRARGKRPDSAISPDDVWEEACGRYGYIFHDDGEPMPKDCDGFMTDVQLAAAAAMRERKR